MYRAPKAGERFLWVRFGALGDVLQSATDAFIVKKRFPEISMSFLTAPLFKDIVSAQPYIDEVLCGDKKPFAEFLRTARLLREGKFDWVGSTFQGGRMVWLSLLGGIRYRLGLSRYFQFLNTYNLNDWAKAHGFSLWERNEPSVFAAKQDLEYVKNILSQREKTKKAKKIFAVIGAGLEAKMLPADKWAQIIRPLAAAGNIVVLNGHGELEERYAHEILKLIPVQEQQNILNLVGKLNMMQMLAAAVSCDIAVGNDSGPLHAAALGGVPSVGIFDYELSQFGFRMPWLSSVTAHGEPIGTINVRHRTQDSFLKISASDVLHKINETMDKLGG